MNNSKLLITIISVFLALFFIILILGEQNKPSMNGDTGSKTSDSHNNSHNERELSNNDSNSEDDIHNTSTDSHNESELPKKATTEREQPFENNKISMSSKFADENDMEEIVTELLNCNVCQDRGKLRLFFYSYFILLRSIREYLSGIIIDKKGYAEIHMTPSQLQVARNRLDNFQFNEPKTEYRKKNDWVFFIYKVQSSEPPYCFEITEKELFYINMNQRIINSIFEENKEYFDDEVNSLLILKDCPISPFNSISPLEFLFSIFVSYLVGEG
ncbi:hypothetical protein P3W45_000805 [Vairimorpha bombi]|jgi:hypothetical protein